MAKQTNLYLHAAHNHGAVTFVNADGTAQKTLISAGADDSDVKMITLTSDDTATVNIRVYLYDGATSYLIGTVRAVTLAGTDGAVNAINIINTTAMPFLPLDNAGKAYIPLEAGWSIRVAPIVAITAAKTVTITATGHNY
jgi:hypothetical protein